MFSPSPPSIKMDMVPQTPYSEAESVGYTRQRALTDDIVNRINNNYQVALIQRHFTCRTPRANRTSDPIRCLPFELSITIIRESLPFDEMYASRLIELTTISKEWRDLLISTPALWGELYVDEGTQDLFSTLKVCLHLARNTNLKLAILGPITDWVGLRCILRPERRRITHLSIGGISDVNGGIQECTSSTLSTLSSLIGHLGGLSTLRWLTLYPKQDPSLLQFDWSCVDEGVRITCYLEAGLPEAMRAAEPSRFFDISKHHSLRNNTPSLPPVKCPNLYLGTNHGYWQQEPGICVTEGTLRQLREAAGRIGEFTCLELAVRIAAGNIREFSTRIKISQRADLVDCLRMLVRLEELNVELGIDIAQNLPSRAVAFGSTPIHALRVMLIVIDGDPTVDHPTNSSIKEIFDAFTELYPDIDHFDLQGDPQQIFATRYLESTVNLKLLDIRMRDVSWPGAFGPPPYPTSLHPTSLQSLQTLRVDDSSVIRSMIMPNLLKLKITALQSGSQNAGLGCHSVRTLTLVSQSAKVDFSLNPLDYPELCELTIDSRFSTSSSHTFVLLSLEHLVSIHISCYELINHLGNQLCLRVLYSPEICPSLQRLHFDGSLEWDILFLMLEYRNFRTPHVERIHTVTLPFVPFHLQDALTGLLAGDQIELPTLLDLSLEATREILWDPTIKGCFYCLKLMWPGCLEEVHARDGEAVQFNVHDFCTQYEEPPSCTPAKIQNWIQDRQKLVDLWRESYEKFQGPFARKLRCTRDANKDRIKYDNSYTGFV